MKNMQMHNWNLKINSNLSYFFAHSFWLNRVLVELSALTFPLGMIHFV